MPFTLCLEMQKFTKSKPKIARNKLVSWIKFLVLRNLRSRAKHSGLIIKHPTHIKKSTLKNLSSYNINQNQRLPRY